MVKAHRDCFNVSVAEKVRWFKSATWDGELGWRSKLALKELMEASLQEEIGRQLGGVERYQRAEQRTDQRNGYYRRSLDTPCGPIPDLRVPRSRRGTYQPQAFDRYQRRMPVIDEMILDIFLAGVSTRRLGAILEQLTDTAVSAATVSRVSKVLDGAVQAYHQRPLQDKYLYLILDGISLRSKGANGAKKVLVLTAFGITAEGRRELIDFRQSRGESEAEWTRFLENLRQRGLLGLRLRLVTSDGAPGLIAALDMVYPYLPRQRCWVHKLRNVSNKLRKAHRQACLREAQGIYLAATRRQAQHRFQAWKAHWEDLEPQAVACLAADIDDLLVFLELPEAHRAKVRTTNAIERSFREVRRRTNPMSCFNNPSSIDRVLFAVFAHLNLNWEKRPIPALTQDT